MSVILIILTGLLCLSGVLLSMLGFSGTWLAALAALIAAVTAGVPGTGTVVLFALLCAAAEAFEAVSGFAGVRGRGGSGWTGFSVLFGGLAGAALGTALLPVIGTLAGLLTGSFAAAFLHEWIRLRHHGRAAYIAHGAVRARIAVVIVKTGLTVAMSIRLFIQLREL